MLVPVAPETSSPECYRGRFAPSPSGPLHFGSLITALGSYLLAKQHAGKWLLRIDDIDTPRCRKGADSAIMRSLESHGLLWDEQVLYQSQRLTVYDDVLQELQQKHLCYGCKCTRREIKARGLYYTGTCRDSSLRGSDYAIRIRNPGSDFPLKDKRLGKIDVPEELLCEDFVLKRRDGIHGYHLVAVVDDIAQGVTQVVRGADLLIPSACQLLLYQILAVTPPSYVHLPVAVSAPGQKLSKQNHSAPLDDLKASDNLIAALTFLGAPDAPQLRGETPQNILSWALQHWNLKCLGSDSEKVVSSQWY